MTNAKHSATNPRRPKGCLIFVLLLGLAAGALHYTGNLQPIIKLGQDTLAKLKARIPKEEPVTHIDAPATEPTPSPAPQQTVQEPPPRQPVVQPTELPRVDPMVAKYRSRFKAPQIGSTITLTQRSGAKISGQLNELGTDSIRLTKGRATLSINRTQLAPRSRARCYEDDYVAYMVNLTRKQAEEKKALQTLVTKMRTDYEQQQAELSERRKTLGDKTNKSRNKKAAVDDMDFKKYMETHGQSDLLKARKKRIAEYEAQRIAEGREY